MKKEMRLKAHVERNGTARRVHRMPHACFASDHRHGKNLYLPPSSCSPLLPAPRQLSNPSQESARSLLPSAVSELSSSRPRVSRTWLKDLFPLVVSMPSYITTLNESSTRPSWARSCTVKSVPWQLVQPCTRTERPAETSKQFVMTEKP